MDPFYAVVRVIARFWIWFFFERVEVRHPERHGATSLKEALYHGELERKLWRERRLSGRQIDPFPLSGAIADAVEHFRKQDPERVERLWQRILGYHAGLAAYRLRDEAVRIRLERTAPATPTGCPSYWD